jgi:hypothetical protein
MIRGAGLEVKLRCGEAGCPSWLKGVGAGDARAERVMVRRLLL